MADVKKAPTNVLPELVDNIFSPEVFANEATSFSGGGGVISMTFSSYRFDNSVSPGVQKRVVIGRLVMPVHGAQALALGLYDYLKKIGLDPAPVPQDPKSMQ